MATEVWQLDRPKGRKPVWACRVTDGATVIFESRSVSVRLLSREAATWLARLVKASYRCNSSIAAPTLEWNGDMTDDCSAAWKHLRAHAEHSQGPRRGGIWYCTVTDVERRRFFHTADRIDIQPRSGVAARWLCELVMRSVDVGALDAYATE